MPGQRGRAEPRKRDKLVDEMGLVEESTVGRQVTPLRRGGPPHERQRAVKPLHAVEPLGGETDLRLEDLDEPAMAEAEARRDLPDGRGAGSAERVEGDADGGAGLPRAGQPLEACRFHGPE